MSLPLRVYLSSFRVGDASARLLEMVGAGPLALIPNAMDHVPEPARAESNDRAIADLTRLGIRVEEVDLRGYFGDPARLAAELSNFDGVWVRGGNTFVLRRAMRLSGFDRVIPGLIRAGFFYGGYSAGICVLAPDLHGIARVDEPELDPHGYGEVIWEGLVLLPYLILPHFRSDHYESEAMEEEFEHCQRHGIPFRTLSDGEVIIIEDPADLVGGS